jgi:hypothetical protein
MIQPINYFSPFDCRADTLSDIKRYIQAVEDFARTKSYKVFWRGQANHEWGLVSSLVRCLATSGTVDDKTLDQIEDKLLKEAAHWVKDLADPKYAEPLAKLAYLQHHGVPTRLLDFTSSPWMAVFFSSESHDHIDGRMFALLVEDTAIRAVTPVATPWRTAKTTSVFVYDAVQAGVSFPRLVSQSGVLAYGRLPSTAPLRQAHDELLKTQRNLLAEEVRRIMSLPFKLSIFTPANGAGCIDAKVSAPITITFRVHVDKESVRRNLVGAGSGNRIAPTGSKISHSDVYPDIGGMVTYSKTLCGLKNGVMLL